MDANYIVSKKLFVKTLQNRYGVFMEYDEGKLLAKTAIVSLPQALSRQLSQGHKCAFAKSEIWTLTYLIRGAMELSYRKSCRILKPPLKGEVGRHKPSRRGLTEIER